MNRKKALTRLRLHETLRAQLGDVTVVMPARKRPKADPDFVGHSITALRKRADEWLARHELEVAEVERQARLERVKGKRLARLVHTRSTGSGKLTRVVSPHTGEVLGEQG